MPARRSASDGSTDMLSALLDRKVARAEHQRGCLLLLGLHHDDAHARPLCRLADRLRIHRIVLVPLYERLDVSGSDQSDLMSHRPQLASPMMYTTARLQSHQAARMSSEEVEQLSARDPATEHRSTGSIGAVRVKNMLGDIETDGGNLCHGRLPQWCSTSPLSHIHAVGGASTPITSAYRTLDDYLLPVPAFDTMRAHRNLHLAVPSDFAQWYEDRRTVLTRRMTEVERAAATGALGDVTIERGQLLISPIRRSPSDEAEALKARLYTMLPRVRITDLLVGSRHMVGLCRPFRPCPQRRAGL